MLPVSWTPQARTPTTNVNDRERLIYSRLAPKWAPPFPFLKALCETLFVILALGIAMRLVETDTVLEFLNVAEVFKIAAESFGELAVGVTLGGAHLVPSVLFFLSIVYVRRRFEHCDLSEDTAWFQIALASASRHVSVALFDIVWRSVTPSGVLIGVNNRSLFTSWRFPLLMPALTEAKTDQVLRRLDSLEGTKQDR